MRSQSSIRLAAIAILLCCVHGLSLGQTLDRPTTPTSQSAPKRQGFFDYALGKINPHGIDYGASMESARNAVVENTIDDLYFWSNVVTSAFAQRAGCHCSSSVARRRQARSHRGVSYRAVMERPRERQDRD